MKRISSLLVVLLIVGGMAMVQGPCRSSQDLDPKECTERMTKRVAKEYSLNETQKKQLLEANMTLMEKIGACPGKMKPEMRQGRERQSQAADSCTCKQDKKKAPRMSGEDREKMWQEMKASRGACDASPKKIMTKEQYEVYTKQKAERGLKRGDRE